MNTTLHVHSILAALVLTGLGSLCHAGPAEEPFYHQFISFNDQGGYQPTRTFTIVTDARHGNRLVAEDDPDLQFNVMWMDQFQPGYKSRNGGAAFGTLLRSYMRSLYDSYRNNADGGFLSKDAGADEAAFGTDGETNYELRLKSDEVRVGVSYSF